MCFTHLEVKLFFSCVDSIPVFLGFWDEHILSNKLKCDSVNCLPPRVHGAQPPASVLFWSSGYFQGFGLDPPLTDFTCALSLRGQRSLSPPEKGYVGCSPAAEG